MYYNKYEYTLYVKININIDYWCHFYIRYALRGTYTSYHFYFFLGIFIIRINEIQIDLNYIFITYFFAFM